MRNAGLILGIIAGMVGMIVGFFASGYLMFVDWVSSEVDPQQTFSCCRTILICGGPQD